ncbi:MAG: hypothetical protein KAT35_01375, partial [Candidatus Aenigmarchaeota archaeon]|nr:hypothetical protein [Candidatus Aenigmarchaeota archaeon]
MKLKTTLFTVLVASLMFFPGVGAQFVCDVVNSNCPSGDTDLLHLFSRENAHAELFTGTDYTWRLCCSGVPGLSTIQQGVRGTDYDVILKLNLPTDSHVQKNTSAGYTNEVYISVDHGGITVDCSYTANPLNTCQDEFGPDYVCLVTMFQDTDSHISDCDGPDPFDIKVCCKVDADTQPPTFTLSEPSEEWINETSFP